MVNNGIDSVGSGFSEPVEQSNGNRQRNNNAGEFGRLLNEKVHEVNELQVEADRLVRDLIAGESDNIHDVLVAVNEADLSFRLMMEVRNKLVEAYQEIQRMQI